MLENMAKAMNEEKMRRFSEAQCPREWCRDEYRAVAPHGRQI